jgi:hypothetical protein
MRFPERTKGGKNKGENKGRTKGTHLLFLLSRGEQRGENKGNASIFLAVAERLTHVQGSTRAATQTAPGAAETREIMRCVPFFSLFNFLRRGQEFLQPALKCG